MRSEMVLTVQSRPQALDRLGKARKTNNVYHNTPREFPILYYNEFFKMNECLGGRHFVNDGQVKTAAIYWFNDQGADFNY
ncbi:hypothetical protein TNIN_343051 [Trichonephila inaurata madagascariensis]|uniref:Uncharacterized protein n=1 Tax=Trichonephila inaurata madagascariensis TaxID=2747483 RepID=A0A8X6MKZ6_9ARAC|nr:hypothetical protein TNIN_343051 [Trichonephila inaurata madagascariensis]